MPFCAFQFTMTCLGQPLTAVFKPATYPMVQVTNLVRGQRISNLVFTVKGKAQDPVGVSNVWYRLNDGQWTSAIGTTAWEAPLFLSPQTNRFRVFAENAAANRSGTGSVEFVCVVTDFLALHTNGWGSISRPFTGNLLELGKTYTVTAIPGAGQLFTGWSGTLSTTANPLTFTMQPGMTLTANFIPNPFIATRGSYSGLFSPRGVVPGVTNVGLITLNVGSQGGFSGKVLLAGATLPFGGAFDLQLQSQLSVTRPVGPPLALNLLLTPGTIDPDTQEQQPPLIAGTVSDGIYWVSQLSAHRATPKGSNRYAGSYTMLVEGCEDDGLCFGSNTNVPWGDSPAAVTVSPDGTLQMIGTLADGTALSQSTAVSEDGSWALFVSLYGGRGFLMGRMSLDTNSWVAPVAWLMPPSLPRCFYTEGLYQWRNAVLAPYFVPPARQNAVNWTNGAVAIRGGDLPTPLETQVVLSNNVCRVVGGGISNLSLTITVNNGLFVGSFVHPVSKRLTGFRGALDQNPPDFPYPLNSGGWFLGPNGQAGVVRLHPQ